MTNKSMMILNCIIICLSLFLLADLGECGNGNSNNPISFVILYISDSESRV